MWEKSARSGEAQQLRGEIPIHHRYTLGVAGERFFKAMRDERRLLASKCPKCQETFLPPKMYCERCFEKTADWVDVRGPGYVKSYTVLRISMDEGLLDQLEVVAVIGWEGIRGGLIHRLQRIELDQLRVGMEAELIWSDQRTGSLEDIHHFRLKET